MHSKLESSSTKQENLFTSVKFPSLIRIHDGSLLFKTAFQAICAVLGVMCACQNEAASDSNPNQNVLRGMSKQESINKSKINEIAATHGQHKLLLTVVRDAKQFVDQELYHSKTEN